MFRFSCNTHKSPSGYSDPSALAETELQELQALKQDLEDFQRARRKLLASTSNLAAKSKAVHSDAGGGGGGGSYPPPYPVPMPMPMPSAHSSLMRPPQQIMMPAQPSGMRMSQQQYMPPQQAYPQSPPQGYGPPPRSPPPRPPPPAQGFEPSMSQGYGGPPSPKITTRISTTKVYKTSPQKPQPRPADHTVKSLNVADKKFDTCGWGFFVVLSGFFLINCRFFFVAGVWTSRCDWKPICDFIFCNIEFCRNFSLFFVQTSDKKSLVCGVPKCFNPQINHTLFPSQLYSVTTTIPITNH